MCFLFLILGIISFFFNNSQNKINFSHAFNSKEAEHMRVSTCEAILWHGCKSVYSIHGFAFKQYRSRAAVKYFTAVTVCLQNICTDAHTELLQEGEIKRIK